MALFTLPSAGHRVTEASPNPWMEMRLFLLTMGRVTLQKSIEDRRYHCGHLGKIKLYIQTIENEGKCREAKEQKIKPASSQNKLQKGIYFTHK